MKTLIINSGLTLSILSLGLQSAVAQPPTPEPSTIATDPGTSRSNAPGPVSPSVQYTTSGGQSPFQVQGQARLPNLRSEPGPLGRSTRSSYPQNSKNAAQQFGLPGGPYTSFRSVTSSPMNREELDIVKKVEATQQKLRGANDQAKGELQDRLQTDLESLFDMRTSTRESQISDLEIRLKMLRDQLEARKARRSEIVRLKVQTLVNEANGLSL